MYVKYDLFIESEEELLRLYDFIFFFLIRSLDFDINCFKFCLYVMKSVLDISGRFIKYLLMNFILRLNILSLKILSGFNNMFS